MAGVAVIIQGLGWLSSKIWSSIMFIIGVRHQNAETNSTTNLQYQRQYVRDSQKPSSNFYPLASHSVSTHHQTNNPSRHSEYTEYYGYNQQSTGKYHDCVCVVDGIIIQSAYMKCANPTCEKMRWRNRNGKYFDYCSKTCRDRCRRHPCKGMYVCMHTSLQYNKL